MYRMTAYRPEEPLVRCAQSGGNAPGTCRSPVCGGHRPLVIL